MADRGLLGEEVVPSLLAQHARSSDWRSFTSLTFDVVSTGVWGERRRLHSVLAVVAESREFESFNPISKTRLKVQ